MEEKTMSRPSPGSIIVQNNGADNPGQGPDGRATQAIQRNKVESHLGNNSPLGRGQKVGLGTNMRGIRKMPG